MNKKGFTLVELIAVIAIIGILSLVVVPNVMNISKNVNVRLAEEKKSHIISAAELYGTNNPDIFGGTDVVYVSVQELIDAEYLEIDTKNGDNECSISGGCISNPAFDPETTGLFKNQFFNNPGVEVKLTKKSVGVVGEFATSEVAASSNATLVEKVCSGFDSLDGKIKRSYSGKTLAGAGCECNINATTHEVSLVDINGATVEQCILVAHPDGNIDNWLKYGANEANWRVIGLYRIDGKVSAKMITAGIIEE